MDDLDLPVVPAALAEPYRAALTGAAEAWSGALGDRLRSLVLFGSVARGEAHADSDVDVLVVATGFPRSMRERRAPLLEAWERLRGTRGLPYIEWGLVTKTPEEAVTHSPLYLDIVEDGVVILDRARLMRDVFARMRSRMRELGSHRVRLADGSWYWDLKPDFRFGEVVEL